MFVAGFLDFNDFCRCFGVQIYFEGFLGSNLFCRIFGLQSFFAGFLGFSETAFRFLRDGRIGCEATQASC